MKKISIAGLLVIMKAVILMIAINSVKKQGFEPKLCNWDCGYYQDIALDGYTTEGQPGVFAFYPAFPKIIKSLWSVIPGHNFGWKGALLNLLLFGLLLVLVMHWAEGLGFTHSWLVALLLSVDRFSLWAQVPYTEVLFLCGVMSFLVLNQKMKDSPMNIVLLASLGGLVGTVRFVGLALVGGLGLAKIGRFIRNPPYGMLIAFLGSWGVLAYFFFLHQHFGNWRLSVDVTESVWGRSASFWGFFKSLWYLFKMSYFPTILLFLGASYWIFSPPKWLRISGTERWIWAALMIIPMSMTIQTSLTRYISVILLGHLAWAFLIRRTRKWPMGWVFDGIWLGVIIVELYFQEQLLEKFLRTEAFSWAG